MKTRLLLVVLPLMGIALGVLSPPPAHADWVLTDSYTVELRRDGNGGYRGSNNCGSQSHVDSSTAPSPYPTEDEDVDEGYDGGKNIDHDNIFVLVRYKWSWTGGDTSGLWVFDEVGAANGNVAGSVPTTPQQPYGVENVRATADSGNGLSGGVCDAACGFNHNSIVLNAFYVAPIFYKAYFNIVGNPEVDGFMTDKYMSSGTSCTAGKAGSATAISNASMSYSTPTRVPDPPVDNDPDIV